MLGNTKGNTPWTRHSQHYGVDLGRYPVHLYTRFSLNLSTTRYPDQISISVPSSKSTFPQFTHLMTETGQWTVSAVDQIFKVWPNNCGKLSRAALLTTPLTALYQLINQVANCVLIRFLKTGTPFRCWLSLHCHPHMGPLDRQMEVRFDQIISVCLIFSCSSIGKQSPMCRRTNYTCIP